MQRIGLILLMMNLGFALSAQPVIGDEVKLIDKADYFSHENLALEIIDWLTENPLDSSEYLRSEFNAFGMEWLSGHPSLKVELESEIMPFAAEYPDLLFIHALASAKYLFQHPESSKIEYNVHGLKAVCKSVKMSKGLADSKALTDIVKLCDDNLLEGWVTSRIQD